jgi:adenylosuccinate synthase
MSQGSGKVVVVVGGQYGSEGKGAIAAYLCRPEEAGAGLDAVRVAGPNAGHTVVDGEGRRWPLRQIPVAAVSNPDARLFIAAGSEIDPGVLDAEEAALVDGGFRVGNRLFIDDQATVIEERHRVAENNWTGDVGEDLNARIGSTAKGIGAARAERIWRRARTAGTGRDTGAMLRSGLREGRRVVIEGTQGYALGLHAGWYPFCTSSDCRVVDFLAMAGIGVEFEVEPWVVLRTYPIRVAGNSGPLPYETTWAELEVATGGYAREERTTVTQRVRRVAGWDPGLAGQAVEANGSGAVRVALTMFDYWYPSIAGATQAGDLTNQMLGMVRVVESQTGARVALLGTGPDSIIDLREEG